MHCYFQIVASGIEPDYQNVVSFGTTFTGDRTTQTTAEMAVVFNSNNIKHIIHPNVNNHTNLLFQ